MNKLLMFLSILALSLSSMNTFADQASEQRCWKVFDKIVSKEARAALVLLKKLERDGRVSSSDISEYERIVKPAMKIVNSIYDTCSDSSLDTEQVDLIEKTLS